jgi:GNAT superfamily N-acetyltransferase|tara:strand:+ start:1346 stop:1600 length:255 start_codon:yes stop_codon:yes gene_type:complete
MVLVIMLSLSHGGLPWAGIESVFVDSGYRRRGIGKLLVDYAASRAKGAGCYKIQLISDKSRQEAHQFYRGLAYTASGHGFRLYL